MQFCVGGPGFLRSPRIHVRIRPSPQVVSELARGGSAPRCRPIAAKNEAAYR